MPSLGVLGTKVYGKVSPPSVEREILTLAQEIGDDMVFAVFQLTVVLVPADQVVAEFWVVIAKAEPVLTTCTDVASQSIPPLPEWLSRTMTLKLSSRATCGNISPIVCVLFKISVNQNFK